MVDESFGLKVLQVERADDRVLILGEVCGLRAEDGWFRPVEVTEMFERLKLPLVRNVPRSLSNLAGLRLVTRRQSGDWALTPLGQMRVLEIVGAIDVVTLSAKIAQAPGSVFGAERHPIVGHGFAPPSLTISIERFLERYPFESNVFCMTRFPDDGEDSSYLDPLGDVVEVLRETCKSHGLTLHLAFDRQLDDQLYGNVTAHMWASQYGIGILEDRVRRGLNYNVVIELGAMLMTGRRCALLKDRTAPDLPTDIAGHIYKDVDLETPHGVAAEVHGWMAADLGLGGCSECPA